MRKLFVLPLALMICVCIMAAEKPASGLVFDASKGVAGSVTMPLGEIVNYTAYTNLYYVSNVEDSTYQRMNVYVPEGADQSTPIFMPNGIGGYMASAPRGIDANSASGRALAEGYVVAIAGARGRNSTVKRNGETVYTGRAPKGLLDLKAAVRYLRFFDKEMLGDAEKIITDGTSAGGAMSSLLGASGNNPAYDVYLKEMGAADTRDDVFASVCFCPIIDLDHADMAYEWLYGCTNNVNRPLNEEQLLVSEELASQFADYVNSLNLKKKDGTDLNADNYLDYVKQMIIASAQEAKDAGAEIPNNIGFVFGGNMRFVAPENGRLKSEGPQGLPPELPEDDMPQMEDGPQGGLMDMPPGMEGGPMERGGGLRGAGGMPGGGQSEYITDLDMTVYLNHVVSTTALKSPPAFDSQGVAGSRASGENEEFGDETGSSVNFTAYSLRKASGDENAEIDSHITENVRLLNPMRMIEDSESTVAKHWYIRHGALDRDTSFPIPINLATKLENKGYDVNFKLPWNRPHSGDYALNELFAWISSILK